MEELFNEFVNEHLFKLSVGVGVAYAGVLIAMVSTLFSELKRLGN